MVSERCREIVEAGAAYVLVLTACHTLAPAVMHACYILSTRKAVSALIQKIEREARGGAGPRRRLLWNCATGKGLS